MFAVPASHALPPLPAHLIYSNVHVQVFSLYEAKRVENLRIPDLANMAVRIPPTNLKPESVSQYDRL